MNKLWITLFTKTKIYSVDYVCIMIYFGSYEQFVDKFI